MVFKYEFPLTSIRLGRTATTTMTHTQEIVPMQRQYPCSTMGHMRCPYCHSCSSSRASLDRCLQCGGQFGP